MADRTPPNDEYAERVMIGLVMARGEIPEAAQALQPSDFYRPRNETIWVALRTLTRSDKPCDITTLRAHLQERELLNTRNGVADLDLFEMLQNVPPAADAEHVAAIILDRSKRRTLIQVFERGLQSIHESPEDVDAQLEMLGKQLDQIPHAANHILAGMRTADWLGKQIIPPLRWVIPNLIPEGYSLLVGAPKIGKSWLALMIALAVSSGGYIFDSIYCGMARPVLLLALEDSDRRIQNRIRVLEGSDPNWPALLHYDTAVGAGGVIPKIETWLSGLRDDEEALIILDTIGKVIPPADKGESSYGRDYRFSSQLQSITTQRPGTSMIGLHHDRKATTDDFVESISGTNGIAGATDTILVINRPRNESEGVLSITGRDVEEEKYGLKLIDGRWSLMGDNLREAARNARTVHATVGLSENSAEIIEFLSDHADQMFDAAAISEAVDMIPKDVSTYCDRLWKAGRIRKPKRGKFASRDYVDSVESVETTNSPNSTESTQSTQRPRTRAREGELPMEES